MLSPKSHPIHPYPSTHSSTHASTEARKALFALTQELRHLRLAEETRDVHVQAFELRRRICGWDGDTTPEEHDSTLAELIALREAVRGRLDAETAVHFGGRRRLP
jgi:hypothetical protein